MKTYDEIAALFSSGESAEYLGEEVMLVEHMLQCAALALEAKASDELVVAALLHDIGHLLVEDALGAQEAGVDARHDVVGAEWVGRRFPQTVSEPIKLHVAAKRYLVSSDPKYFAQLSPASVHTLNLQGGFFTEMESQAFLALPGAEGAIQVRLWDDQAKIAGKSIPDLSAFKPMIDFLAFPH
ncbi:MAG: HD domain-containing protein [Actinomycetes bacterium]